MLPQNRPLLTVRQVVVVAIAVLLSLQVPYTVAQQKPAFQVAKFDTSTSYRTNVCERQRLLWNDEIAFPDALQGLNLSVSITNYQIGREVGLFTLDRNGRIKSTDPGLFAVVLDELAKRAGFEWRDSFNAYPPRNATTDGDKSWTDILKWNIDTFDISMEKWGQSVDRMQLGASFPVGFWDSSVILGEIFRPSQNKRVVNLWSFLEPFGSLVWLMIVVAIIVTGLVYWLLEYWNTDADERELDSKPLASIFYAAIAFTGHYELRPNTHAARIVGFSFTFWALIVASAYTANLASFLVSPRVAVFKYSTIEEAIQKDAAVCVQGGAIIQTILNNKYPDIQTVGKDSEQDIFTALRLPTDQGGCDAVAHQFNSYEIYEHIKEVNYDCAIASEKRVVDVLPAGMATAVDTGLYFCTSLVSHVLDYHLTGMLNDGFMENAWDEHLKNIGTIECISDIGGGGGGFEDDTFSLTVQDVGGIFIVHVVLAFVAVLGATYQFYVKEKTGAVDDTRTLKSVYGIVQGKEIFSRRILLNRQQSSRRLFIPEEAKTTERNDAASHTDMPTQSLRLSEVNEEGESDGDFESSDKKQ